MESDDAKLIPPMLDEHDTAAVVAILIRTIRAQDETGRDQELIKAANARIAANNAARGKAIGALSFFGFQAPEEGNIWHVVRDAIGGEAYDKAVAEARGAQIPELLTKMGGEQLSTEDANGRSPVHAADPGTRTVSIRTAILDYLRNLGDDGATVGQVKRHLVDAYGITVHEKTPGMTLYRLLKDELVMRKGRTWFANKVAKNEENEAPTEDTEGASEPR